MRLPAARRDSETGREHGESVEYGEPGKSGIIPPAPYFFALSGSSASEKFSFWQKSHSQEPLELLWFSSCRAQAPLRNFSANLILNRHLKGIDENRFGSFHDDLVLGKGVFHRNENFFLAEAVRQASALAIRNSAAPAASSIHKQA